MPGDSPTPPTEVREAMVRLLLADGWTEDPADGRARPLRTFRTGGRGAQWCVRIGAWDDSPATLAFTIFGPDVDH